MKIILFGATGFIGKEVLDQCVAHNYIEHIFCLTRTPLDPKYFAGKRGHKVTEIIHNNYEEYPDSLLRRFRDAGVDGCIWALGGTGGRIDGFRNLEEAQKVGINYPIQAAEACAKVLAVALSPKFMPKKKFPFRFIFVSGWGAEQDQFRSLWLWNDSRKIKGAAEKGLFEVADTSDEIEGERCFEVIALRAGQVIRRGDAIATLLWEATVPSVAVDRLAICAIKSVLMGTDDKSKRILENAECLGKDWAMINTLS